MAELEDPYADPEPWIVSLVLLNARLGAISRNYLRDDMQLISHVLMKLPKELYGLFITTYQVQGFTSITLFEFQSKLREFWRSNVKLKADNYAMTVEVKQPTSQEADAITAQKNHMDQQKKDRQNVISNLRVEQQRQEPSAWGVRMCTNCGRAGHEAHYCRSGNGGRGGRGHQGYNQQPRTCYHCKQPGHLVMNCPYMPRQNHLMPGQVTPPTMNHSQGHVTQTNVAPPQPNQSLNFSGCPVLPQVNTSHHDAGQTTQDTNSDKDATPFYVTAVIHEPKMEDVRSLLQNGAETSDMDISTDDEEASDEEDNYFVDDSFFDNFDYNNGPWTEEETEHAKDLCVFMYYEDDDEEEEFDQTFVDSPTVQEEIKINSNEYDIYSEFQHVDEIAQYQVDSEMPSQTDILEQEFWEHAEPEEQEYMHRTEEVQYYYVKESYLLDSGATCHVTNDRARLKNVVSDKTRIVVGENSSCHTEISGTLELEVEGFPKGLVVNLNRVFYVPQFNKKVISVPRLSDEGYHFTFKGKTCEVHLPNGGIYTVQSSIDNLYYWNVVTRQEVVGATQDVQDAKPKAKPVVNINDMHDKYGHLGETLLRKTLNHLGYEVKGTLKSCDACKMAKAKAKSVKKKKT